MEFSQGPSARRSASLDAKRSEAQSARMPQRTQSPVTSGS